MTPAYELPKVSITAVAKVDFTDQRYTFGTIDATTQLIAATAGGDAIGVIQTPGIVGEPCNVMTTGVSFIKLGGTVAAGAKIAVGANGTGIVAATEAVVIGICLVGGALGEIGSILLK